MDGVHPVRNLFAWQLFVVGANNSPANKRDNSLSPGSRILRQRWSHDNLRINSRLTVPRFLLEIHLDMLNLTGGGARGHVEN